MALQIEYFRPPLPVYLASASPRRFELLKQMGLSPRRVPCEVDESVFPEELAEDYVLRLARAKANAGWTNIQSEANYPLIAADTSVVIGQGKTQRILGKPVDPSHAVEMLRQLSGGRHFVLTGVAVRWKEQLLATMVRTEVHFVELTATTIQAYVDTGEGTDKAGGYAIQGLAGQFVESISGSYSNVVGLPLLETRQLINQLWHPGNNSHS